MTLRQFPGSNSIDGGVTLSLTTMRDIKIADDNSTVEVGPGSRWVDVYGALSDYGLYAIGGRMKTIGVSGLELIGGFHYLNNKYGMAMDNVVSYDVVLGNGTQVTADAILNPDLFWALKGGANNFGIVTKFVLKAYPIPLISTTYQSYNESHFEDLMVAATEFTIHNDPDIAAGTVINVSYNSTNREYSALLLGVQEGTESPPSKFANFSSIPSTSTSNNVMPPVDWHNTLVTPNQMFR